MKTCMLILLLTLLACLGVKAQSFTVDGIAYTVVKKTVVK